MRTLLGFSVGSFVMVLLAAGCGGDEAADPNDDDDKLQSSSSSSSGDEATSSSSGGSSSSSSSSSSGGSSGAAEACSVKLVWLQKDAYKETGGRTTDAWPPHTTTTLEITCDGTAVGSAFQANHGSEPGSKDLNGRDFLDVTKELTVEGTRAELEQLLATYRTCECEPDSFLSMNSLDQTVVEDLLEEFIGLVQEDDVVCQGATTKDDLVAALQAQNFEAALPLVPQCVFPGADGTPVDTLNEALELAISATSNTLDDYHVCNNDAVLQANLVEGFLASGTIGTCDRQSAVCKGPLWLYDPNAAD